MFGGRHGNLLSVSARGEREIQPLAFLCTASIHAQGRMLLRQAFSRPLPAARRQCEETARSIPLIRHGGSEAIMVRLSSSGEKGAGEQTTFFDTTEPVPHLKL